MSVPRPPKIPTLTIKCPYCNREVEVALNPAAILGRTKEIQTCRSILSLGNEREEKNIGCGKDFILVTEKTIKCRTLKIEGEDN